MSGITVTKSDVDRVNAARRSKGYRQLTLDEVRWLYNKRYDNSSYVGPSRNIDSDMFNFAVSYIAGFPADLSVGSLVGAALSPVHHGSSPNEIPESRPSYDPPSSNDYGSSSDTGGGGSFD